MNPSNNQSAGIQPPAPVTGQAPVTPVSAVGAAPIIPTANVAAPSIQSPVSPMTTIPLPLPGRQPLANSQTNPNPVTQIVGFQVADDKDVIEPEWVNKAKAIAARNRSDPYKQSEELTVFKADYMQKRYNKSIKLK